MTSIYRETFNKIKALLLPLFDNLGVKTIHFGGMERIPLNQIELDSVLNMILVKPSVIDETFINAQRIARHNVTIWKIYYIMSWSGQIDDFDTLILGGEQILDAFDENLLPAFNVIKPNARYRVIPKLQEVQRVLTENEAEIFMMTSGANLKLKCIILEVKIESLINKIL